MTIEIEGSQFNPKTIRRFVQKQFEKNGLVFSNKDPEIAKRLVREGGYSLAQTTLFLRSGLQLKLGIKFTVKAGKILPKSKGLIYLAKLGTAVIPLAKPKGEDYDWTSWIRKISDFVGKKEKGLKPKTKPPTISKSKATDNRIPNTFKAKLDAKRSELKEKEKELERQDKLLTDQEKENTQLQTEIDAFK